MYNPNAKGPGSHLYTADTSEKDVLSKRIGWKYEGIAWYAAGLKSGNSSPLPIKPGETGLTGADLFGTIQDGIDWSNPH